MFDSAAGRLSYYVDGPRSADAGPPLLLLHSINAAASADEVRPLYLHYRAQRRVYAPDLPGYGHSERGARDYSPRLMTDAVHAMLAEIAREEGAAAVDGLAVSLSCEYLARAACERPAALRSVALVSPTGFNRSEPLRGTPGSDRGVPWLHRTLRAPLLGRGLFRALTSRRSVRFFLRKTWGSRQIDEQAFEYAVRTAREPGAQYAPFRFLSGFLFSADSGALYESLQPPVWMAHGTRGDFTDYRLKSHFAAHPNWRFRAFATGALPYFEKLPEFISDFDAFLAAPPPEAGRSTSAAA